jgi:Asp-tRNA(Asn)/Glu-tRNA(Gln) amidotransferase A subunit family amidase
MTKPIGELKRKIRIASLPHLCPNIRAMRHLNFLAVVSLFIMSTTTPKARAQTNNNVITRDTVLEAQKLFGLHFSDAKIDLMLPDLNDQAATYERLRKFPLSNSVPSAMLFNPLPVGMKIETVRKKFKMCSPGKVKLPANPDDLAFYSVEELGVLIKSRQITSEQLTRFYLERLKKYGPKLNCVVTLTEELALQQARRADMEIAAGKYRGPLHGIPYGAKDLLATKGIKTTWGSVPYKEQVFDEDATVIKRLEAAGAVLVAKLSMGELAWGEVWYGGMTRNPWDVKEGSGGSSAGPGAATAAGLVAFSIGSETHGSIVDPCSRCGVTGLRPTYGRVSRTGAMALSWSMDKLGPICRTVEDCAVVFNAIYGPDGIDQTVYDAPFNYDPGIKLRDLKIGYLKSDFDKAKHPNDAATLSRLRELGANLIPLELPRIPLRDISFVLSTEAAAAFDDLTRSGRDDLMVRQIEDAWPNVFRSHRFVPAVEYIQAQRVRYVLIQETAKLLEGFDLFIAPSFDGNSEHLTNLTGHPCVVLPNGFGRDGIPTSICFIGNLFGEAKILAAAKIYQDSTDFHKKHPKLDE